MLIQTKLRWQAASIFGLSFAGMVVCRGAEEAVQVDRFEREVIVANCLDAMQMEVIGEGEVILAQRNGEVLRGKLGQPIPKSLGRVPVAVYAEVGMIGMAVDRDFDINGWVYLFHTPERKPDHLRISRFKIDSDTLDLGSEHVVYEYPFDKEGAIHMGGGLWMDDYGDLWIGTGDNSPPIPELPVDRRPGRENFDAMRSSANSRDPRGKVLRIHPEPDGSYSIPAGNLFSERADGLPEIYAMGCRNPFRISVDSATQTLFWGDVGPNIEPSLNIGPNGYDEFNRATRPGNFGWPMFVGRNEAYREFDFTTRTPGALFNAQRPLNESPNNTGLHELPTPQPAMIWYPSTISKEFPMLGLGGRSAMAGPVYRESAAEGSSLRLPDQFDNRLFIYEWTRNWIQTVAFDGSGNIKFVEPFLPDQRFRKPIDMKFGPEGALYLIEYGDKWGDNSDSQVTRIVYRRGNRAPRPKLSVTRSAGAVPLQIIASAEESFDPDDDSLRFEWFLDGKALAEYSAEDVVISIPADVAEIAAVRNLELKTPGPHELMVRVTDSRGVGSEAVTKVTVGNAAPQVSFSTPLHGSFFDWGDTVHYQVSVEDEEDGNTIEGRITSGRVLTSRQLVTTKRLDDSRDPGLALMRKTTCFSCHTTKDKSAGPPYQTVALKYAAVAGARERLAEKIVSGGTGVWGDKPMPPHPQHTVEETRMMVDWIFSLANSAQAPVPGTHGFFRLNKPATQEGREPSILLLTSEYTDEGNDVVDRSGMPLSISPQRGAMTHVLHSRRKPAAQNDAASGADIVEVFEGGTQLVARLGSGDWIAFEELRLDDIDRLTCRMSTASKLGGNLSVRAGGPAGSELARVQITGSDEDHETEIYREITVGIEPHQGLVDLYFVAEPGHSDAEVSLAWVEFHDSPVAIARKAAEKAKTKKIVLIPTKLDHAWATHMYTDVCRLLAVSLNQTPGIEAIVSPDLDWPRDPALLEDADAIVYYSRPAGDILLSAEHREEVNKLLTRGVGFTAIHWSTGAEEAIGPKYEEILGGWFNFAFSGLKVDQRPLLQVDQSHPICRGWSEYELRDEFYLNLKFHPDAKPVLVVDVDDVEQVVAWTMQRSDGGLSFGTTLGHFHENYSLPQFRRMIVNGILWTVGAEIPEAGSPVDIDRSLLELEDPNQPLTREWTFENAAPLADAVLRGRSFAEGEKLFQQASCAACHRMQNVGGTLGPDLSDVRTRLAINQHPRAALLREILDPSYKVDPKYGTWVIVDDLGTVVSGLIVAEDETQLTIRNNPNAPDQTVVIPVETIVERKRSSVSMMPTGLLNRLNESQVLDLIAFVESGGDPAYHLYQPRQHQQASWADSALPIKQHLQWWLDASKLNAARTSHGLGALVDGQRVDVWFDASGNGHDARQRQGESQPLLRATDQGAFLQFDGVDDYLVAGTGGLITQEFTVSIVVRPDHNLNWPGIVSANAISRNDYQSGFNVDLMNQPTEFFESIMTEGPGYQGVINLMNESHPYGQFMIVTVVSRPGAAGVSLRINGRPQQTRDRGAEVIQMDELVVAARYWSNDPTVPPFNRGFLQGGVAKLLMYDRALSDDELVANEVYLWESTKGLLEPAQ